MAQMNLNLTDEFVRDLRKYMKARGFSEKSAAIRAAVHEASERAESTAPPARFAEWIGLAKQAPLNPSPRFADEDALWEPSK